MNNVTYRNRLWGLLSPQIIDFGGKGRDNYLKGIGFESGLPVLSRHIPYFPVISRHIPTRRHKKKAPEHEF